MFQKVIVPDSLLQQVAAGNQSAVQECIDRYGSLVWSLAKRWSSDPSDAEDATQDVFLLAYRKLATFRGDSSFSTWLYRLAYNRAIDYRRRLERQRRVPLEESEVKRLQDFEMDELGRLFDQQIATLMQEGELDE